MAEEQVIGLRVQLNGMNTVIQDVETFEKLLREAKEDLKQIPIGSKNFKDLQREIKQAEGQLGRLTNEQQTLKKEFKDFSQIGTAITSAFAGAAAAISLMGGESEEVTKAQKIASQALTVVLSAQAIAQTKLGGQTIATTIAQRAQTAATNTSSAALQRLYAIIAANPIGALIAAIGLLVVAFQAFGSEADVAAEKQARLNALLDESKLKYDSISSTIELYASVKEKQMRAEGESEEEITKFLKNQIKLRTEAREEYLLDQLALTELQNQARLEEAEREDKLAFEIETIKKENANRIGAINAEIRKNRQKQLADEILLEIDAAERKRKAAEEAARKTNERLKKLFDERVSIQQQFIEQLSNINDLEIELQDEVIEKAQKYIQKLNALQTKRNQFFVSETDKFVGELNEILFEGLGEDQINELESALVGGYDVIYNAIKNGTTMLLDEQGKAISFSFNNLKNIIDNSTLDQDIKDRFNNLSKTSQQSLSQFFTLFAQTAERYSGELTIADKIITISDKDKIQQNLTDLIAGTKEIFANEDILPGDREIAIKELINSLFTIPEKTQKDFITTFDKTGEEGFKKYQEGIQSVVDNLYSFSIQQNSVTTEVEDFRAELAGLIIDVNQLNTSLGNTTQLTAEQITTFTEKLAKQVKENINVLSLFIEQVSKNTEQYIARFGKEGLIDVLNGLTTGLDKIESLTKEQLVSLLGELMEAKRNIEGEFGEGTAVAFDKLIDRIKAKLAELPTEADEKFKQTLDRVEKGLQTFQQTLGQIGTLIGDQFTFALEKLEFNYSKALDGVVGDTKEANAKRLELEEGYQKEKKEIEKRARLTSLRITLAETIASGAQAVVSALKLPPPAGQILAGINAGITALQLGLIAQQISLVQQYRRGGKVIMASGGFNGLVQGASHEYGGVKLQSGGIEVEGNEAIINRSSTIKYGSLLSTINQAQGGRPIMVGSAMDSRLIEVLAKQKQEPIRAYVVEQDITKSQQINRKLEQLASF